MNTLIIKNITKLLTNNYEVNNSIVNTWNNFLNYIYQYDYARNDVIKTICKQRILDFYWNSFLRLKELKNKINLLNINNKNDEKYIKSNIDIIINHYLNINIAHMKQLN